MTTPIKGGEGRSNKISCSLFLLIVPRRVFHYISALFVYKLLQYILVLGIGEENHNRLLWKVKPIDYPLSIRICHNWHQIINYYSICALCFYNT